MIELQARVGDLYDWHTLELSEDAAIPLTYSFADPEKLMSREGSIFWNVSLAILKHQQ